MSEWCATDQPSMQHLGHKLFRIQFSALDGVSPLQVCISSSEKMKNAKDEAGILIYEWIVSEFSGKAFSHPSPFTETHMDWRFCTSHSLFYHQLSRLNPLRQLGDVLSSAALFSQRERVISFHLNPNDTSLSLWCHVLLCQLRCHVSWKESVFIQAISHFSPLGSIAPSLYGDRLNYSWLAI